MKKSHTNFPKLYNTKTLPRPTAHNLPCFTEKITIKHVNSHTVRQGNNPMVGMTVACAVAIEEACK